MHESFSDIEFEAWFAGAAEGEVERQAAEEAERQATKEREERLPIIEATLYEKLRAENLNLLAYGSMYEEDISFAILEKAESVLKEIEARKEDSLQTATEREDQAYDEAKDFVSNRRLEEQAIVATMADGYYDIICLEPTSLSEAISRKGMLLAEVYVLRQGGLFDPLLQFIQGDILPQIGIDLDEDNFQPYIDEVLLRTEENALIYNEINVRGDELSEYASKKIHIDCDKATLDVACIGIVNIAMGATNKYERSSRIDAFLREQGVKFEPDALKALKKRVKKLYPPTMN